MDNKLPNALQLGTFNTIKVKSLAKDRPKKNKGLINKALIIPILDGPVA